MADPFDIGGITGPGSLSAARPAGGPGPTGEVARAFGDLLQQAMSSLQQDQAAAKGLMEQFAAGGPVDISQVTIAMEEASLAMQLLIEVRNQIINAHETLMRMPV
ncbi:MAG TPA: flagellar hook-basal body complex protein FliE [bacterium]|nr:flagellar hook-basal body complex protein FliE [bacterium]